jgi:DNA-binding response OmpR family regulator
VEDDARFAEVLGEALRRRGWAVDVAGGCAEAYAALRAAPYQAVVLDLGLPDGDGMTLLRGLRAVADPVPVLVLTARGQVSQRVAGLDAGADDYVVKPVTTPELQARLLALARRASASPLPALRFGPIEFDRASRLAVVHGRPMRLTLRPAMVLEALMLARGRFVQVPALADALGGFEDGPDGHAIKIYVSRLRRALEAATGEVRVENQRGFGYRLARGEDA